ncbi:MAG TPA: hypothetical protein PLQ19_11465 [Aeromicrobium sp.]|nr:hypothetical protein [Aeromicrobium sp.]
MQYADPKACPSCRGPFGSQRFCPNCGFDLQSQEALRLWSLFLEADQLVAAAKPGPAGALTPTQAQASHEAPAVPQQAQLPRPRRSWSVGSILLGLGALCLVVAGFIFVTIAWGDLGILGRALILLAVTALIGVAAGWASRKTLIGTAEALWVVFLALLTLDVFAAVGEGLFGLDWDDFAWVSVVWTVLVCGAAALIVKRTRPHFERNLISPQVFAGLTPWVSGIAVTARVAELNDKISPFWPTAVGFVLIVLVVLAALRLKFDVMKWVSAPIAVFFALALVAIAATEVISSDPPLDFYAALPMLTLMAAAIGISFISPRITEPAMAVAGVFGLLLVWGFFRGVLWFNGEDSTMVEYSFHLAFLSVAVASALIAWTITRPTARAAGERLASVAGAGVVLLWCAYVATVNFERADQALMAGDPSKTWVAPTETFIEAPWLGAVAFALLVVWGIGARRWTSPILPWREFHLPVAVVLGAVMVVTAIGGFELPYVVHGLSLVAAGLIVASLTRGNNEYFAVFGPVLVLAGQKLVPSLSLQLVLVLVASAIAFALIAWFDRNSDSKFRQIVSATGAALTAWVLSSAVNQASYLLDFNQAWLPIVQVGFAAALVLLAMGLDEYGWHRIAVEVAAALIFAAAMLQVDSLAMAALAFTIGATACAVVGLLDEDRKWARYIAGALAGLAWIFRLAASDVTTIEAYTAPFAVALLAAGWWHLHTKPASRTWTALTPGLVLALLPSLPEALDDPTSLRALLSALAAAISIAVGVALRWGAPLVAGAVILALIVLANIWPTAAALERWILMAIAGLVLLVIGTTWEKRVAEGKALIARVRALR